MPHSYFFPDLTEQILAVELDDYEFGPALQRVKGRLEGKLPAIGTNAPDITVFIVELRDIKRGINLLKKTHKAVKRVGTLRKGAKVVGDLAPEHHLNYNFGVAPFISDLIKLVKQLATFQEKLKALKDGVGKVHDLHVSYTVPDEGGEIIFPAEPRPPAGSWCGNVNSPNDDCMEGSEYFVKRQRTFRLGITVKYRYSLPDFLTQWEETLFAFLAQIGYRPGLKTLWELIPFSFVVDWFYNVESMLPSGPSAYPVKVDIIDICLSQKLTDTYSFKYDRKCFDRVKEQPFLKHSLYQRVVGSEALSLINDAGSSLELPSFSQFLLGASLLKVLGGK